MFTLVRGTARAGSPVKVMSAVAGPLGVEVAGAPEGELSGPLGVALLPPHAPSAAAANSAERTLKPFIGRTLGYAARKVKMTKL